MIKKLSLKGLADFMTASPSRQRKILRAYKYPSEDEARAKILYYREARDRIAAFHVSPHDVSWLSRKQGVLIIWPATASARVGLALSITPAGYGSMHVTLLLAGSRSLTSFRMIFDLSTYTYPCTQTFTSERREWRRS